MSKTKNKLMNLLFKRISFTVNPESVLIKDVLVSENIIIHADFASSGIKYKMHTIMKTNNKLFIKIKGGLVTSIDAGSFNIILNKDDNVSEIFLMGRKSNITRLIWSTKTY